MSDLWAELIQPRFDELMKRTERYPNRTNAQIGAVRNGPSPDVDVEACRVILGKRFPEDASHGARVRMLWAIAALVGLRPDYEVRLGTKRADLVIRADDDLTPLAVLEIKSGMAHQQSVAQVSDYRDRLGGSPLLAVVVASSFRPSALRAGQAQAVLMLTGAETVDLIRTFATTKVAVAEAVAS